MINGTIVGNVGQDPRLETTKTGKKVAVFSLAINRNNGETRWYKIKAWNGLGEKVVMPYVHKGDQIAVAFDAIETEAWASDDSIRGQSVLVASDVKLLNNQRTDSNEPQF